MLYEKEVATVLTGYLPDGDKGTQPYSRTPNRSRRENVAECSRDIEKRPPKGSRKGFSR